MAHPGTSVVMGFMILLRRFLPRCVIMTLRASRDYLSNPFLATLVLLIAVISSHAAVSSEELVDTIYGQIVGFRKHVIDGDHVVAYLGIPYAKPPVGSRRYKPPETMGSWRPEVKNASAFGSSCVQVLDIAYPNFTGSEMWNTQLPLDEDCLYLNVWVPSPRPSRDRLPVMVWIFGGGFYGGVATLPVYDGSTLAATQGVIVVSMNYRVGSYGFLSFGNSEVPGNMGLLDQAMALQWVQDNIEYFNGDPDKVTLFGESAGAVSIGYHLQSRLSQPLFNRAIMQSGTSLCHWGLITNEEARERAMKFARGLNCVEYSDGTQFTDAQILACLRTKDPNETLNFEFVESNVYIFPFVPVVDGVFITETPKSAFERYAVKSTDIMLGSNKNEGSFFMIYYLPAFNKDTESLINNTKFNETVGTIFESMNKFAMSAIKFQYTDWLDPRDPRKLRDAAEAFVTDYKIACPIFETARAHTAAHNNAYLYRFQQRASNNPWAEWMGVLHGDEIAFAFGQPLHPSNGFSEDDIALSRKMMRLWSNFAKTGNPNTEHPNDPDELAEGWPPFRLDAPEHYILDSSTVDTPLYADYDKASQCAFWREYLPKLNAQTADINEAEMKWKEEFHQWSTKYMVDWKAEFDNYIYNKDQECSRPNT
ncbi:acetylcholinesterase-like isoform X1 [Asterias rubens]|uniref:acetylcholinesterase-like isoform X1 n=2 Tax=Asterias rubens TaxID=7604 RepID=UPI001455B99B|nr:acetylcholinesterase-like isoform X1 [Asterias rubens]